MNGLKDLYHLGFIYYNICKWFIGPTFGITCSSYFGFCMNHIYYSVIGFPYWPVMLHIVMNVWVVS